MSETCFNSYVKTFENLLGNEPELELEITEALIANLNDTIYGNLCKITILKNEWTYLESSTYHQKVIFPSNFSFSLFQTKEMKIFKSISS